jgi:hypothetical protein
VPMTGATSGSANKSPAGVVTSSRSRPKQAALDGTSEIAPKTPRAAKALVTALRRPSFTRKRSRFRSSCTRSQLKAAVFVAVAAPARLPRVAREQPGPARLQATPPEADVLLQGGAPLWALTIMTSLVSKVGPIVPRESGERVLCAAYVSGKESTIGSAVVAVSDRNVFFAPRSAFLSRGAWQSRRLDEVRIESSTRRSLGFPVAHRFDVFDADGSIGFEIETKKDAREFRKALSRRLAPRR